MILFVMSQKKMLHCMSLLQLCCKYLQLHRCSTRIISTLKKERDKFQVMISGKFFT